MPFSDLDLVLVHEGRRSDLGGARGLDLVPDLGQQDRPRPLGPDARSGDHRGARGRQGPARAARRALRRGRRAARARAASTRASSCGVRRRRSEQPSCARSPSAMDGRGRGRIPARTRPQGVARRAARRPVVARIRARAAGGPTSVVRSANTLLLDVRAELHRNTERAEDVLRQQEQDGIAVAFDLADVDGGAGPRRAAAAGQPLLPRRRARPRPGLAAHRRHRGGRCCAGCSARPTRCARASLATSWRRTARSCSPATPIVRDDPGLVLRAARAAASTNCRSPRTRSTGCVAEAAAGRDAVAGGRRATTSWGCSARARLPCRCWSRSTWPDCSRR